MRPVGQLLEIADFDPEKRLENRNAPFDVITLENGGGTSESTWAWSDDTLMDLDNYHALKMEVRTIGGTEFHDGSIGLAPRSPTHGALHDAPTR